MLKIKSLSLKNWMFCAESKLDFPERGVVWVSGVNNASHGKMSSIGAGKTSFGIAVARCLFGGEPMGEFSRAGKGNTKLTLTCTLDGKDLVIENGYKEGPNKTGEWLRYTHDGTVVERDHIRNTRLELSGLIGLEEELSNWTVMIHGDRLDFDSLSLKDSVNIVSTCLNLPDWTPQFEAVKARLTKLTDERTKAEGALEYLVQKIDKEKETVVEAQEQLALAQKQFEEFTAELAERKKECASAQERTHKKLVKAKEDQKELRAEMKGYEEESEKKTLEIRAKKEKILSEKKSRISDRKEAQIRENDLRLKIKLAKHRIEHGGEARVCEDCKQQVQPDLEDWASWKKKLPAFEKDFKAVGEELLKLEEADEKSDEALEVLSVPVDKKYVELSRQSSTLSREIEELNDELQNLARKLETLKPDHTKIDRLKHLIDERKTNQKTSKTEHRNQTEQLSLTNHLIAMADWWKMAYSPSGIPNMALQSGIELLNHVSDGIANDLTGGLIRVKYSPKKTLATGAERASLTVSVENLHGAPSYKRFSKGEAGLVNIFVSETFAQIANVPGKVGYRWYDEVLNSQDPVVKTTIRKYLKKVAHERNMLIFMVDHDPEAEKFSDHVLVATKDDKGTTYDWR